LKEIIFYFYVNLLLKLERNGVFMIKYPKDFKMEVVQYYLNNSAGYLATAKHFNLPSEVTVLNWVKRYQIHGEAGLERNSSISYTREFKEEVVKYLHKTKASFSKVGAHFNIAASSVREWEVIYNEKGAEALGIRKKQKRRAKKRKRKTKSKQRFTLINLKK